MNDEQRAQIKRIANEGRQFAAFQKKVFLVRGEPIDPNDSDQVIAVLLTYISIFAELEADANKIMYGDPSHPAPVGILHSKALKKA